MIWRRKKSRKPAEPCRTCAQVHPEPLRAGQCRPCRTAAASHYLTRYRQEAGQ